MSADWVEITIITDQSGSDIAAVLLWLLGCRGTVQRNESNSECVLVQGYIPSSDAVVEQIDWLYERMDVAFQQMLTAKPARISTRLLTSEEWEREWQEALQPITIGHSFIVIPSHAKVTSVVNARIPLLISASGGFGTGHHPTTRMCLELMESIAPTFRNAVVLDVGCGSGILSIAAVKLGARHVVAVDIEADALECTNGNATANAVADRIRTIRSDLLANVDGRFDVVLSNLVTELVRKLSTQMHRYGTLKPGAY
ncbi:TPA: methyltransferase domain-containing protein, partial [Candidatus Bipolaricaulota bacterium]|nr:methyltransferase domain-containing protein [Candidatus Bipolaricaulota bacterium]